MMTYDHGAMAEAMAEMEQQLVELYREKDALLSALGVKNYAEIVALVHSLTAELQSRTTPALPSYTEPVQEPPHVEVVAAVAAESSALNVVNRLVEAVEHFHGELVHIASDLAGEVQPTPCRDSSPQHIHTVSGVEAMQEVVEAASAANEEIPTAEVSELNSSHSGFGVSEAGALVSVATAGADSAGVNGRYDTPSEPNDFLDVVAMIREMAETLPEIDFDAVIGDLAIPQAMEHATLDKVLLRSVGRPG